MGENERLWEWISISVKSFDGNGNIFAEEQKRSSLIAPTRIFLLLFTFPFTPMLMVSGREERRRIEVGLEWFDLYFSRFLMVLDGVERECSKSLNDFNGAVIKVWVEGVIVLKCYPRRITATGWVLPWSTSLLRSLNLFERNTVAITRQSWKLQTNSSEQGFQLRMSVV